MLSPRVSQIRDIVHKAQIFILDSIKDDPQCVSLGKSVKFEIEGKQTSAMIG